jgi:hypothetical protein
MRSRAIPASGSARSTVSPRSTRCSSCLLEKNGGTFPLEEVQKAVDLSAARREFAGDDADNREFFDASMASLIRTLHAELRAR